MRIWHLILATILVAVFLTLVRDPVGRVAMIVFVTGLAEIACATTALMALFRTFGALGESRGLLAYAEATVASCLVLIVASFLMNGMLWVAVWALQRAVA